MKLPRCSATVPVLLLAVAALLPLDAAVAQGVQTGEIRGVVTDTSGAVVPDVAVSVTSPALQGARLSTTDRQGGYIVRGLPPGTYAAAYSLAGFSTTERSIELPLGSTVEVNVSLGAAPVTEE